MSEQKWSPEPWAVSGPHFGMRSVYHDPGHGMGRQFICGLPCEKKGTHHGELFDANASRIVSCVNGCRGINPEAVPELIEALQELYSGCVSLDPEQAILPFQMQQAFRALTKCGAGLSKARVTVIQQASNSTEKDGE